MDGHLKSVIHEQFVNLAFTIKQCTSSFLASIEVTSQKEIVDILEINRT